MKRPLRNIKKQISKFPLPFWLSFYLLCVVIALPLLAYLGTFSRGASAPSVVTGDATAITESTATLSGSTSPTGFTEGGFEYGLDTNYGSTIQDNAAGGYTNFAAINSPVSGDGQFSSPLAVAWRNDGRVYLNSNAEYVYIFNTDGTYISRIGGSGTGDGQFSQAKGMVFDAQNNLYVLDNRSSGNTDRVQVFDSSGNYLRQWSIPNPAAGDYYVHDLDIDSNGDLIILTGYNDAFTEYYQLSKYDTTGSIIGSWTHGGTISNKTGYATHLAIGDQDNIYVTNTNTVSVQRYDSSGDYVSAWTVSPGWDIRGVDVNEAGDVFVAVYLSASMGAIKQYSSSGVFVGDVATVGDDLGQVRFPYGVAISEGGTIFVAEQFANRIQIMSTGLTANVTGLQCGTTYHYRAYATNGLGTGYGADQTFTTADCPPPPTVTTSSATNITQNSATLNGLATPAGVTERGFQYGATVGYGQTVEDASNINYLFSLKWGSSGSGDGQLSTAYGIATDSADNVYVSDIGNNNIQKFDSNGNFISKWGSFGSGDGQFRSPYGIDVDSVGNIYVADYNNNRIQKFDSNGNFISKWGSFGSGDGQFRYIQGLGVSSDGLVYVADSGNDRIQKFDSNGNFISKWGSNGSGNGQFNNPVSATVDSAGNVYVADFNNDRIQKFDSNGTFITKWGTSGTANGQLAGPYDLDVDSNDNVIVIEGGGDRAQKFDSNGTFINKWGSSGSGDGQFNVAVGIAVDSMDEVYTTDFLVDRIQKFSGSVMANVSSLACGTVYHYRAYAINAGGTGYGADQTFTTVDCPPEPFIFRVKTDIPANSSDTQFIVPVNPGYIYDFNVDCNNDGTPEHTNQTSLVTCNYGVAGEYDIAISGTYPHMFNASTDPQKIIDVKQWGTIAWQDMSWMFYEADNLEEFTATDTPDLSSVLKVESMFFGADLFNENIESWDVSGVTDFSSMFSNALSFNQPLSGWNMSNATDTSFMFEDTPFNQTLNNWDVSNVTNMSSMFQGASSFSQPLNNWDTSSVTDMSGMFYQNTGFNQDISSWNTSNVTSIIQMFTGATAFNQPLNSWDTSKVVFFQGVFFLATSFNQPLNNWDVSAGNSLQFTFAGASSFNQDISNWNTSNITNMSGAFTGATSFDQSLASWDVSNVADMTFMFGDGGGFFPESSGLSVANYDATLIAWSQQNLQSGVTFDAGISQYCSAEAQRQSMIDLDAWTINDDGKNCAVLTELPTAPRNLRTSNITTVSIRLDWDPPVSDGGTEITAYQVQYRTGGTSTWINAPLQAASPTAHIFINLNSGNGYEFRVAAINAVGQGPFSDPISAATLLQTITPTQPDDPADPPVTPVNPEVPTTDAETNTPAPNTPTYSRPRAQQALPMKQSTLGAVMGPLVNFVRPVPRPIARAIPWTILLLLIAIACLYAYSTYQEHKRRQAFEKLKQRFTATLAARATFLEITSHYIKTPITKIQGVIELLQGGVIGSATAASNKVTASLGAEATALTIPEETIVTAQQAIRSMTEHANELLDEGQALTGRQQAKMQIIDKYSKLSILTRPGFWLPFLVVVTLTIMTNFIFIQADKYEASVITVVAQGLIGIVGIIAVAVSLYFLRASRIQSSLAKQQSEIEAEILTRQQRLIEGAVGKFDDDLLVLNGLNTNIRRYPKTEAYSDGLEEFQKIVSQFKKLDELSRIVPGISWNVPLGKTINSAVSTLGVLAEQRGVTIRANSSDKAVNVAVSQDALTHLISAPLKNALLVSGRGTSVEINVSKSSKQAEVVIRDAGPGIPADKLASIFQPFNSVTDTKRFSNTGLGLDLYLAKVIAEQYGCDIKLESIIGEGVTVHLVLPISKS